MNDELRPGRNRHFKSGLDEVTGVATPSETQERLVVHRPRDSDGRLWVRPVAMCLERVARDGGERLRFEFVGAE